MIKSREGDPKSGASANSATLALFGFMHREDSRLRHNWHCSCIVAFLHPRGVRVFQHDGPLRLHAAEARHRAYRIEK